MNKEEMLHALVENGFDFLEKAIDDIEKNPKYSVINFHAAVELFLKARLMSEHWSLVISDRQKPDWDKFITGNFQSISLDGAADRLEKVVRSGLTKSELTSFREVTKHRNKAVHFFHEAHSKKENQDQVRNIVKQQLTAWYFLHNLLTNRWDNVFSKWTDKLKTIDGLLKELHAFLQVIYDQLKPELERKKLQGVLFNDCPSCGFKAQRNEADCKIVYDADCLVCGLSEKALKINCTSCGHEIRFVNEGFGNCDNCNTIYEPDDLAEELLDSGATHSALMDGDDSWDLGNCAHCDGYHTVVRTDKDDYICTSCFLVKEYLRRCDWCNEPNTGDMEHSSWTGCSHCDGRAGWEKDD
jgi:hypothetical protein